VQPTEIRGKRFSVLGAARSGLAVARLLHDRGARVFVSDHSPAGMIPKARNDLDALGIAYEFGENSRRILDADVVVVSPGIPSDLPIVKDALALTRPVLSEVEVASWFCPGPIVGITGTNGKTTTTSLLGRMFEDAKYPAAIAGNIGTAFSQVVGGMTGETTAILEISSFQLDHIETFRPRVASILNITPDHLDRYDHSFEKYIAAKCRIFENQRTGDTLIYNYDDQTTRTNVERRAGGEITLLPFSQVSPLPQGAFLEGKALTVCVGGKKSEVVETSAISIRGAHNIYNAMAATLAAKAMGIPTASLRATLKNFKGVEHRLEFVRELHGVTYVNDSKGTNVDSVWFALQSFAQPIVVMLGGRDKGNDYSRLHELVKRNVRAVVAIGESAEKVKSSFEQIVPVTMCSSMEDAVRAGQRLARQGDVVLLSPACASFDWFENYEHRGRVFKDLVHRLT
jgi:UDP-N-acetylmuramoylalanine--D-glutamate ligase